MEIPQNLVLLLSGVPCVGKTTAAYNIIKKFPEFRRVSEIDIIRTVVRAVFKNLENNNLIDKKQILKHFSPIFDSLSESDLVVAKQQSKLLIPYVKEIVDRQQLRKIPTIIEGTSIIPSTYFVNDMPIEGFENNILFVNLYLSDEQKHLQRRIKRCEERKYADNEATIKRKVAKIRNSKNLLLHKETLELNKKNVFSIDVANMDQDQVVDAILDIIRSCPMYD